MIGLPSGSLFDAQSGLKLRPRMISLKGNRKACVVISHFGDSTVRTIQLAPCQLDSEAVMAPRQLDSEAVLYTEVARYAR